MHVGCRSSPEPPCMIALQTGSISDSEIQDLVVSLHNIEVLIVYLV
jgi:hypothetical protein